jgi:tRNA G18 (ribose-2'-O)-methylase SpoU
LRALVTATLLFVPFRGGAPGSGRTRYDAPVNVFQIEDPDDERLSDYRGVRDPDLVTRKRLFVAEGRLVVRRLLDSSRVTARSAMVTRPALAAIEDALAAHPSLPVYVVPQPIMDGITGFNIHRGCLALGERPAPRAWPEIVAGGRRVVVLERVGNADNVGSIFRNAAAFGAAAVLLGPACADPLYRKAIRTSMGAVLTLPFAAAVPWPDALRQLRDAGWDILAMTPSRSAQPLRALGPGRSGSRIAIVVGHEGEGLTSDALDACTHHARIPLADDVDSLNVATAAAIALYELGIGSQESEGR